MEKVKIKRAKRIKKQTSAKAKVLAGLGVGATVLGGVGAVSPKQNQTQFVRAQSGEEGSKTSKVKETLKRIFGVGKAQAMTPEEARVILGGGGPATQAQLDEANQVYYGQSYNNAPSVILAEQQESNAVEEAAGSFAGAAPLTVTDSTGNTTTIGTVNHIGDKIFVTLNNGTTRTFNNQAELNTFIQTSPTGAMSQAARQVTANYEAVTAGTYNLPETTPPPPSIHPENFYPDVPFEPPSPAQNPPAQPPPPAGTTAPAWWPWNWGEPPVDVNNIRVTNGQIFSASGENITSQFNDTQKDFITRNLPNTEDPFRIQINRVPAGTRMPDGSIVPRNDLVDLATAQAVATAVGGQVVVSQGTGVTTPQYSIVFPDSGEVFSPLLIANMINSNGLDYAKNSVQLERARGASQPIPYIYRPVNPSTFTGRIAPPPNLTGTGQGGPVITSPTPASQTTTGQGAQATVSYISAHASPGDTGSGTVAPGHTVELGGINLNLYNRVTLLVNGQEFSVSNAVISANRITFTMPNLGTGVLTGARVQVRLSSATGQPASITFSQTLLYSAPSSMGPSTIAKMETADEEEGEADLEDEANIGAGQEPNEESSEEGEADLEDGEEEESAAATASASDKTIKALQDEVKALQRRVADLNSSLSGQSSSAQLTEARGQIASLTAEVMRLNQLVLSLSSGQVRAFATVDQMAEGLKMPPGYSASSGLRMPSGYPASQGYTASAPASTKGSYTVKRGDTLWSIAKRYYGDGKKWRKILEANPQALSRPGNPKTLKVGAELVIPEL